MSIDFEEQYDKIYRYCYFKLASRETAEDITQETFLRFLECSGYTENGKALNYLYTIAHNLCIDEYRKKCAEPLKEEIADDGAEAKMVTRLSVKMALQELKEADRELLLLRYVNEVPVSVISKLYGISRFAVYRRLLQAQKKLKYSLGKEEFDE